MILHCSYYRCYLSVKCPGMNEVCFWKSSPTLEKEAGVWRLTKAEVSGKLLRGTKDIHKLYIWRFKTFAFLSLISLSCTLFVSKKNVLGENSISKSLRHYWGDFTKADGSVIWETRTLEQAGGNKLGELKGKGGDQLLLSLWPINICRTSDSSV